MTTKMTKMKKKRKTTKNREDLGRETKDITAPCKAKTLLEKRKGKLVLSCLTLD